MSKKKIFRKTIDENFTELLSKSKQRALSIREISKTLSGQGSALIILFLSLPFCLPINIPGLSTPFGIAIAFLSIRIIWGKSTWIPKFILDRKLSKSFLRKFLSTSLKFIKKINPITHPRWTFFSRLYLSRIINGFIMFFLGLFLALPLPIPFTNFIPAWAIFFISWGILQKDGIFIFLGYLFTGLCTFIIVFFI